MTTQKETKLKILFKVLQSGHVITAQYLEDKGISKDLRKYYLESGWLDALGRGAYKKPGDNIEWQSGISAIQEQTETKVHVGGLSALSILGFSHYFRLSKEEIYLFSPLKTKLPKWFADYNWKLDIIHKQSSFLPNKIGIKELKLGSVTINISSPERAIMECLFLAPQEIDLVECYHIFEGLVNLKPKLVTELLINCKSIKVKRLFLYMAEKANHQWFQFLKTEQISLGNGNRMLTKEGVYIAKYLISIPKELTEL